MNPFPAIEVRNLDFSYEKTPVLSGVNFSVNRGDFLSIIGPNGGGKSTLMKLVVGLLKPSARGSRLRREGPFEKISLGYVPQNTNRNLEFPITVEETVSTGLPRFRADRQRFENSLKRCGWNPSRNGVSGSFRAANASVSSSRAPLLPNRKSSCWTNLRAISTRRVRKISMGFSPD